MSTSICVSAMVAIATVLTCSAAIGQSVALDHVDGLYAGDTVYAGQELTFHLRMETDTLVYWGISNGFRIYGTGGMEWDTTTGGWTDADSIYPRTYASTVNVDGAGTDTIGFSGFIWDTICAPPSNYSGITWTITVGPIDEGYDGETICLDSSFFPLFNPWKWVSEWNGHESFPSWDGPHCFAVHAVACCELRGDANGNDGGPDIEDLIYLNNYVNSGGPAPPCMDEGDVNDDGSVNQADVDYLQAYMFGGGPAPVACE